MECDGFQALTVTSGGLCQSCDFSAPYSPSASATLPKGDAFPPEDWCLMLVFWLCSEVAWLRPPEQAQSYFMPQLSGPQSQHCPPASPLARPGAAMHELSPLLSAK